MYLIEFLIAFVGTSVDTEPIWRGRPNDMRLIAMRTDAHRSTCAAEACVHITLLFTHSALDVLMNNKIVMRR